jgi:hypothetical protein
VREQPASVEGGRRGGRPAWRATGVEGVEGGRRGGRSAWRASKQPARRALGVGAAGVGAAGEGAPGVGAASAWSAPAEGGEAAAARLGRR